MNYTLHQLQVFAKVVQTKSITKAAEELYMSQPAVSIQLKNLQDQFEIPLTEVIGRQLYITDFGKEIYGMAERIINEVYAINYKTMSYKGFLTGRLVISVVSTGKYVMPYFLNEFLKENEGIDLVMDVTNKSKVISSLQNNEVDFALVSVVPRDIKVFKETLMENHLYVVGGRNEQLPKHTISKNELKEMPLIYREEGSGTRHVMESYFSKHKINIRKKMELTTNEAVKQAVIAGLGNSIMPLIGLRNDLLTGDLKILPTVGFPIKSQWQLIWLQSKKMSPVAQAYIDYLKKSKNDILRNKFSWIDEIPIEIGSKPQKSGKMKVKK
ncbi:MAG: LysR family transcriptional regulator [Bacteroidia bacterium]|nr:LysR family transcriptional regulator [Bacteroidia bacterium]